MHRARPHFAKTLQFLLGGLFSAYAILYSQSASFSTTAIFLGIIVGCLIANEFLENRYSSLKMLVGLFAIVTFTQGWTGTVITHALPFVRDAFDLDDGTVFEFLSTVRAVALIGLLFSQS